MPIIVPALTGAPSLALGLKRLLTYTTHTPAGAGGQTDALGVACPAGRHVRSPASLAGRETIRICLVTYSSEGLQN